MVTDAHIGAASGATDPATANSNADATADINPQLDDADNARALADRTLVGGEAEFDSPRPPPPKGWMAPALVIAALLLVTAVLVAGSLTSV